MRACLINGMSIKKYVPRKEFFLQEPERARVEMPFQNIVLVCSFLSS